MVDVDLRIMRLDENDVAGLYRRYPGMPGPQRCLLTLSLTDGSFAAGYEQPGRPAPEPVGHEYFDYAFTPRPTPVLCWPIPCLTAEGANQVLDTLAPLATRVLWGTIRADDTRGPGFGFQDVASTAGSQITRLCDDLGLIVDLMNEVIEEHDAPGWFEEDDLAQEYGITARTSDEELDRLAARLDRVASPYARPVAIVLGVPEYLTGLRDGLRTPVTQ